MSQHHDNPYPVDSETRQCCKGIGAHTQDCKNPDPDLAVPAGATADGWNTVDPVTGVLYRSLEWSKHDTGRFGVGVDGFQGSDGEITRGVSIYGLTEGETLTAQDARQIAAKLIEAAAALDQMSFECGVCEDTGKVRVSTGKWTCTRPCPECHAEAFEAAEVDGDHFVVGPARADR